MPVESAVAAGSGEIGELERCVGRAGEILRDEHEVDLVGADAGHHLRDEAVVAVDDLGGHLLDELVVLRRLLVCDLAERGGGVDRDLVDGVRQDAQRHSGEPGVDDGAARDVVDRGRADRGDLLADAVEVLAPLAQAECAHGLRRGLHGLVVADGDGICEVRAVALQLELDRDEIGALIHADRAVVHVESFCRWMESSDRYV